MNKIWNDTDTEQEKIDKLSDICQTTQSTNDEAVILSLIEYLKKHQETTFAFGNYQKYAMAGLHIHLMRLKDEYHRNPFNDAYQPPENGFAALNLLRQIEKIPFFYRNNACVGICFVLGFFRRFIEAINYTRFDFQNPKEFSHVSLEKIYMTVVEFFGLIENEKVKEFLFFEAYVAMQMLYNYRNSCQNEQIRNELLLLEQSRTNPDLKLSERLWMMRACLDEGSAKFGMNLQYNFAPPPQNLPKKEFEYQNWCLDNCYFLDFRNLYKALEWAAAEETLALPKSVSGNFELQGCFMALKTEYDHNRRLLYKIFCNLEKCQKKKLKSPTTNEKLVFSPANEDLKLFFRNTFGLLDRVVSMLAVYFKTNGDIAFTPSGLKKLFKNFGDNDYLISLYWLSCDLADNANIVNWHAPNPAAKEIKQVRNCLEHNFLLIADKKSFVPVNKSYIKNITEEKLIDMSCSLFEICRNAIFYAVLAISLQEKRKNTESAEGEN